MQGIGKKRFWAKWICAALTALAAGCGTDSFYELFTPDPVVQLPKDEAPHDSGGEWWYYTGRLTAETGERFGVETVIFHFPGFRLLLPTDIWVAHYAVLKESDDTFHYSQTKRWSYPLEQPVDGGFNLDTQMIQMRGYNGRDQISAAMADGNFALNLELIDQRGAILHGRNGYISYAYPSHHSFYYSRPQMLASGTLQIEGQTLPVTGEFWFDRQWGRDITSSFQKWDWFSLRLDDGSDIMLFVFRDTDPPLVEGTWIPPVGDPVDLTAEDFTITPTEWWTSPNTNITYPVAWQINIPSQDLALTVKALANDQELDVRPTTLNIYWEGECTITGTRTGQPVAGSAYVELTNYPPNF